jgi:hypothetical protein
MVDSEWGRKHGERLLLPPSRRLGLHEKIGRYPALVALVVLDLTPDTPIGGSLFGAE